MLELTANDPLIKTYLKDLQHLKSQAVEHELGLRGPFQNLLDKAAKKRGCPRLFATACRRAGLSASPSRT